jgi:hypothetical protein
VRLAQFSAVFLASLSLLLSSSASAQKPATAPLPDILPEDAAAGPALAPAGQRSTRRSSKSIGDNTKDPITKRMEETSASLAPPGGVLGQESNTGGEPGPGREASSEPAASGTGMHIVQKGDTLWSLCARYYGDPWRWPQLWASNPAITNPHWIFPGDVIRLGTSSGGETSAPFAGTDKPAKEGGQMMSDRLSALISNAVVLREIGFIEARDLAQAATVSGSREEKEILATGDQAYLRFPKDRPLKAGERYSVFETDMANPVKDPDTGKTYGYLVKVRGDIVVDQIAGADIARGTITDVVDIIERGARVSAAIRQFRRVEPRPSDVNLEGRIVASFSPAQFLAAERFVVVNRGRRDGVQVGNRTFVIRRGDGYRDVLEDWEKMDPTMPKEVVGEVWMIDVRENASVAWIARSTKELKVGEVLEMRKGY